MDYSELQCELEGHNSSKINFACMNENCNQVRYGCFRCVQLHHIDHFTDVKEFSFIKSEITNCEKYSDIILEKIENFIREALGNIIKIRDQLQQSKEKYKKFPGQLTMSDLKMVLDEVTLYSQGKYQRMLQNVENYINELKVKLDQGSKILTSDKLNEEKEDDSDFSFEVQQTIQVKRAEMDLLFSQDKYEESMALVAEILNLSPNDEEALHTKANILNNMDQPKKAIQIYYQILKRNPNEKIVQRHLLQSYLRDQQYQKAYEICEQFLEKNPDNFGLRFMKGKSLFHLGKYDMALCFLMQLDEESFDAEVKHILGETLIALGSVSQGIDYLKQAILYEHQNKVAIQKKIDMLSKFG